ncbi:MAG: heavy-metal-associated domain-containing protein [Synergistaceae bacterium]|nr:heavy-metal-associated domain-containing protein [Synergistaceae bacterium]MBR0203548.1 heavy-metal-associated domain-containing protein [Synergistaceae bacterium]
MKKLIHVEGMGCQNCVKHVTEALINLPGVTGADVSLEKNQALVTLADDVADDVLRAAIDEAGYYVSSIEKI